MTPAYNTDTPFTAEDIARFNRFTHFPKDQAQENARFANESANERSDAKAYLKAYGKTETPKDVGRALERVRKARYEIFIAAVRSRELAPPPTVVGPARYREHARPERAQKLMRGAFDEYHAAKAVLAQRLRQHGSARTIRAHDLSASAQLEKKISVAQQAQERMKTANAIIRDPQTDEAWKIDRLQTDCGIKPAYARELLKPDFAGRMGFAAFELSNNAANIRRMQDRVAALKRESVRAAVTFHFPGGRVEDSAVDSRVRIYHKQKPAPEIIGKLKANEFHWSPRLGCWQRLRNEAARHAAAIVTGVAWPKADAPETTTKQAADVTPPKAAPAMRGGIAV